MSQPNGIDKFLILREIGRGGMGVVHEAHDISLDRRVALKRMKPEIAGDQDAQTRFLREARAAAKIRHDRIVTIFELGECNGTFYIAMDLLIGWNLSDYLTRNRNLSWSTVCQIIRQVAEGLAVIHQVGMIHRDIKPSNIFIEDGQLRVRILDFGVARRIDGHDRITAIGIPVGSVDYWAPEQARGEPVDERADLFSLGRVVSLLRRHTVSCPSGLCDLERQLLQDQPSNRPGSAEAVIQALDQLQPSESFMS